MTELNIDFNDETWSLEEEFNLLNLVKKHKSVKARLCINLKGLVIGYKTSSKEKMIHVKPLDIIGIQFLEDSNLITLLCYPYNVSKEGRRRHLSFSIECWSDEKFQLCKSAFRQLQQSLPQFADKMSHEEKKKTLVLINPKSGPGKSYQIFRKQVVPLLSEAAVEYAVVITKEANHARDMMLTLELQDYKAIVTIGGDGLLYEVYNGLGSRQDWRQALATPIGVIPGGSGNGLAKTLAYWRDEKEEESNSKMGKVLLASMNVISGSPEPIDLVEICTAQGQRIFSFMSFGFGLIADIDIESERLRMLGEMRFSVYALAKIAGLNKYKARISFKRADKGLPPDQPEPCAPAQEASPRKKTSTRKADYSHVPLNSFESWPIDEYTVKEVLGQPVPHDWETIEGEFIMAFAVYQTHISTTCHFSPRSTPDDGLMYLFVLPGNLNRTIVTKFLLQMETGSHLDIPGLQVIPTTAIRMEPLGEKGRLVVDGEAIPYGPIQAKVLPSQGRVLVRPPVA